MKQKLIILDRDGVINEDSDAYIKSPDELIPIPGSLAAIAQLNGAGYSVAVATNQSGIARGYFDMNTLQSIHDKLNQLLEKQGGHIDVIVFCPHGPEDNCDCRKPKSGMLSSILAKFAVPVENTVSVGDSLRDLQAAAALGIKSLLVRTGKGKKTEAELANHPTLFGTPVFNSLSDAVDDLLK